MAKSNVITPRISEIAAKIRGACLAIVEPHGQMLDAQDIVKEKSGELQSTRLSVALEIAAMSSADKWLPGEIEHAVKYAAKSSNDPDNEDRSAKTLATFMSEMRVVASPKLRDAFPTVLQAIQDAWDAEEMEMKSAEKPSDVPTPVRKYASRLYHCVMQISRAVKEGNVVIQDAADVVAWAKANDPSRDEEKVAKRLAKIVGDLQQIFVDFGHDDIKTCVEYLETISAKELLDARQTLLGGADASAPVPTPAAAPAAPSTPTGAATANVPAPTPQQTTLSNIEKLMNDAVTEAQDLGLIQGAYDPLNDLAA